LRFLPIPENTSLRQPNSGSWPRISEGQGGRQLKCPLQVNPVVIWGFLQSFVGKRNCWHPRAVIFTFPALPGVSLAASWKCQTGLSRSGIRSDNLFRVRRRLNPAHGTAGTDPSVSPGWRRPSAGIAFHCCEPSGSPRHRTVLRVSA